MSQPHPLDAAATVPDLAAVFAAFAATSASARAELGGRCDLSYGPSALQRLDVFEACPGAPLVVFIHGGYWRRLDKSDVSLVAAGLVPLGVTVALLNYDLAPQVRLPTIVEECRRGVAWLLARAQDFGFDPQRVTLAGHSAGAHLAAMCAVEHPVSALVSLSGLHDLGPVRQSYVNAWLGLDAHEARTLSPANLWPAHAGRVLAMSGERESSAFHRQSEVLVAAWTRHGCAAHCERSAGDDHFTICQRLANPSDPLVQRIAAIAHGEATAL